MICKYSLFILVHIRSCQIVREKNIFKFSAQVHFRCDSISQHLPLSVSEWVSGPVIDSFRFGDSYRISERCELVQPESSKLCKFTVSQAIARLMTSLLSQHCWCTECIFEVCTGEKNRSNHCVQSKSVLSAVPTLTLQCSVKGPKWIANSSIALHKVTKWVTSSSLCHYLKIVQCGLYGLQNVDDQL